MNLEHTLHQRWADNPALAALLPPDRVTTGRASAGTLPRATITRRSRRSVCRTNSGDAIEEVAIEILLQHDRFDDAAALADQVIATFDRTQFNLAGDAKVLSLRRTDERSRQLDDSTWQFHITLLARIHLPPP